MNFFAISGSVSGGYVYYKYAKTENNFFNVLGIGSGAFMGYVLGATYGCLFGPYLLIGGGLTITTIKMKIFDKIKKEQ
jgi:hypothetical protein